MSDERVLLTSEENPIYHNPSPTDPDAQETQKRWKGKVLLEFYETGQYRLFEDGEPHKELARYVVVWDRTEPRIFIDGMWTDEQDFESKVREAVLAPGTTEEIREAFRKWVAQNPHVIFGNGTLDIDRDIPILPVEGSVEKAHEEMGTLFDEFIRGIETTK